ncbi:phosphate starvation protein PhoH [Clostridia bacterium]|nr:phosphate starvation protein PhoH [Clostridia bacterium]
MKESSLKLTCQMKKIDERGDFIIEVVIEASVEEEKLIFGPFDEYAKLIEQNLKLSLIARNGQIKLMGEEPDVLKAQKIVQQLLVFARKDKEIHKQQIHYLLSLAMENQEEKLKEISEDILCKTVSGKPVKPKTIGQKNYVDTIRQKMIVFGLGPAGTGKTYLAMAMAIQAFKNHEVNRIILTRPAIEAGEKLGFLPGDLQSKVDPYLRPLYDALHQIMGVESFVHNSEKGLIEVAPLAYMRGRTLDQAYIILDEAQNTTPAQMKMFLTRIGFGSKVIITGDLSQKDLSPNAVSGLEVALNVLKKVTDIGFVFLDSQDVVRHPLVQKIVLAYESYEKREEKKAKKR